MAKATWNGAVVAESDTFEIVEGNVYFPPQALVREHFKDSATTTECGWKGTANYFDVVVDGQVNKDAAWIYRSPKAAAKQIKDYVAFWRGVVVDKA